MPEIEELSSDEETFHNAEAELLNDDMQKMNMNSESDDKDKDKGEDKGEDKVADKDEEKEEVEILTEEERTRRMEEANVFKVEGNRLFKLNEYESSIEQYKKALDTCPKASKELRVILSSNLAAATDHLGNHEEAIEHCNQALKLNPQHIKALLRRAQLYRKCDKLDESLADYEEYCKLVPDDRPAKRVVQELNIQINERNEKLKTEMMGKLKDLGNMFLKPFGLSTENFQMVKNPETGNYSVNFNNGKPQ